MRVVLDTNVLFSYLLFPDRGHATAVRSILINHEPLYSEHLIDEVTAVLGRERYRRFFDPRDVAEFIYWFQRLATRVDVVETVQVCRDPKDDHILSLAISGKADCIVTGDGDLLSLHPFRDIVIVRVVDFDRR